VPAGSLAVARDGFQVAFPVLAQALAGRLTPVGLGGAVALSTSLFIAARFFWSVGLRRYSGASA
jgi:ABC-type uncharacterized transport system permease subunit